MEKIPQDREHEKDKALKELWDFSQEIINMTNVEVIDLNISAKSVAEKVAFVIGSNFAFVTKMNPSVTNASSLQYRLKMTVEAFKEAERRLKIAYEKAQRWDSLRTWLLNLLVLDSVKSSEKIGIKIALRIMGRIEKNVKADDYDETGESQYIDAMEHGISKAEEGHNHWSDEVPDPESPTTFMGKTGYLATCEKCGLVVMLDYSEYSYETSQSWTCEQSDNPEMIEACKQKQAADDGTSDQAFDAWREGQTGRRLGRD